MCAGCGQRYRRPVRRVVTGSAKSTVVKEKRYLPKRRKPLRRSGTRTPQGAVKETDSDSTDVASASESAESQEQAE